MKKLVLTLIFASTFFLSNSYLALAADSIKNDSTTGNKLELSDKNYDRLIGNNRILSAVNKDENDSLNTLQYIFQGKIITTTNIIIGAVALVWIFILAFKMIFSGGSEDELSKHKSQLGWILAGLATVSVAEFAGFQVFDPTKDLVNDPVATDNFHAKLMQINLFFQYIVGGLVLISCIRSGYNLIMITDGEEEVIQKEKEVILSILFGAGIMLLSEVIITGVIFVNGNSANATQGVLEIVGLINFALSFVAGACAIMLVLASLYYVSSLGNEDRANRAKQIIFSCIFALVIIFSAYTIMRFLI